MEIVNVTRSRMVIVHGRLTYKRTVQNLALVAALEMRILEDIVTNTEDIVTNTEDIVTNMEEVVTNTEDIVTNTEEVVTNKEGIVTNTINQESVKIYR